MKSNKKENADVKTGDSLMPYDMQLLSTGLQEVAKDLKGKDITAIAYLEQLDQSTVREYLKGNIGKPAIGRAILNRGRALLIGIANVA